VDVLQGICCPAVEIGRRVDVAGLPCEVASREPGECEVAGRAELLEGLLGCVDPLGCEVVVALGRE
jgi:hypothetical protein